MLTLALALFVLVLVEPALADCPEWPILKTFFISDETCTGSSTEHSFDAPWCFSQFLAHITATPGVTSIESFDAYFFHHNEQYDVNIDVVLFNLTVTHGVYIYAYDPVLGTSLNPENSYADQDSLAVVSFTYSISPTLPAVLIEDSQEPDIRNMYFNLLTNDLSSARAGIEIYSSQENGTSICSNKGLESIILQYVGILGGWHSGVFSSSPLGDGTMGLYNFIMLQCVISGTREFGVVIVDFKTTEQNPLIAQEVTHEGIFIFDSYIGETGDASSQQSGTCLVARDIFLLYSYNNMFQNCGGKDTNTTLSANAVEIEKVSLALFSANLFMDMMNPSGAKGANAFNAGSDCPVGLWDHNVVQRISRSALVIQQEENGVLSDESFGMEDLPLERHTSYWYIAYNLFEMIDTTAPAIMLLSPGCTANCMTDMNILQNTFYSQPKAESFPDLLIIDVAANELRNASLLNNVFYSTNGTAASTAMVRITNAVGGTAGLNMAGNVYAMNVDSESYALLNYAGQPFLTLASLRTGEMYERSSAGYFFNVPSSIVRRLIDLNPPSDFVDPVQGDPEAGSSPNANGDFINGVGLAVNSSGFPLSPFNAPGHERELFSTTDIPVDLTEAYNYRDFSPAIGAAIDLTDFYDPEDIEVFGEYDLVQRFIFDLTRPNAFDSGAFRYLTKADFSGSQTFEDGQYAWAQWEIEDDTELVFQTENSLGNFTVERAFNVPSNATVTVGSNGRLLVREGNATASGTLVAGFNSTLNYFGNLKLAENGTLSIDEAFNVTLRRFEQEAGAKIRFKEGTTAFRVLKGITLNGEIDIVVTTPPSKKRVNVVVAVASYPAGTSTGGVTRANAVIGYPGGECDQFVSSVSYGVTSLSVTLSPNGKKPNCPATTLATTTSTVAATTTTGVTTTTAAATTTTDVTTTTAAASTSAAATTTDAVTTTASATTPTATTTTADTTTLSTTESTGSSSSSSSTASTTIASTASTTTPGPTTTEGPTTSDANGSTPPATTTPGPTTTEAAATTVSTTVSTLASTTAVPTAQMVLVFAEPLTPAQELALIEALATLMGLETNDLGYIVTRKRMSQVTSTVRGPTAGAATQAAIQTLTSTPSSLRSLDSTLPDVLSARAGDASGTPPATVPASSGGLPLGAIIGIAVGCVVVGIGMVLLLIWYRKRRQAALKASMTAGIRKRTVDQADQMRLSMEKDSRKEIVQDPYRSSNQPADNPEGAMRMTITDSPTVETIEEGEMAM